MPDAVESPAAELRPTAAMGPGFGVSVVIVALLFGIVLLIGTSSNPRCSSLLAVLARRISRCSYSRSGALTATAVARHLDGVEGEWAASGENWFRPGVD